MKKKLVSICLVVLMLLAMLPTTAYAKGGGGQSETVDHIDIDVRLETTLVINGEEETVSFPSLTTADADLVQISGVYSNGTPAAFTRSGVSTSTDGKGNKQIRIKGTFPIGTGADNQVKYTVSITKDYEVDGIAIPVTLSATVGFWDASNVCPGQGSGKGIDLKLGEGSANCGLITVQKTVAGAALTADKTFQFQILDASTAVFQTVSVTVPAGKTTAAATVMVPYGTYKVVELADSATLDGYKLTTTYQTLGTEKTDGTVSVSENLKNQTVSVTNTYEAEVEMVGLYVTKEWDDAGNQDGLRPASVKVQLLANGEPVEGKTATLSAANQWTWSWNDLPEKDASGAVITYSVRETPVKGYEASYDAETGVLTNTHTPETIEKLVVEKKWDDADDQDGIRPDSIEVQLLANGQNVGEPVELNEKNNWTFVWEDLYRYAGGEEIVYTVEEIEVPDGYVSDPDGLTITNTHVPEVTSVYVTKEWDDADDQDEIRPDSVTVRLMKNDEQYQDAVELSAKNQWTWSWQELPKYENGKEIVYTVVEDPVEGYTANYDAKTGVLTNSHTPDPEPEPEPETVDKTVTKVWDDANDQDGIRPDSVKVQLLANGKAVGEPVELTEKGQWTYTWTGLLKFEDGEEIVYTFEEAAVEGYTAAYEGDKIVNTHTPDAVNVTVVKKWVDGDSKDRPTEITVQLYADGEALGDPVKVTKDGGWSYVWKNLPANADGKAITYTVKELNVPAAYNATYSKDTLTITNTLKDIPKSGDSANLWLYGGIMVVCAAAVVVLLTKKKRGEA